MYINVARVFSSCDHYRMGAADVVLGPCRSEYVAIH